MHPTPPGTTPPDDAWRQTHLGRLLGHAMRRFDARVLQLMARDVQVPLALSNLLQVLFNMSDVAVVGRFAGSTALGSVGSTSIFVTLFTGFLIGLSNGINVLVARFYGARHADDVEKTVHSALLVSIAAGVLLLLSAKMLHTVLGG